MVNLGPLQDLVATGYLHLVLTDLGTLADGGPFQGLKDLTALDLLGSLGDSLGKANSLQALQAFGNWFLWVRWKTFGNLKAMRDVGVYMGSDLTGVCY